MINPYYHSDIEKYKLIIEQLEICKELINSASTPKARMALILLDNIADVIMYRYCISMFEYDDYYKKIVRPKYSPKEKKQILKYFEPKLAMIQKLGEIGSYEVTVLRVLHSYRNAAYHRDKHNPSVIIELSKIMFKAVCSLFVKIKQSNYSYEGFEKPQHWLTKYKLKTEGIVYKTASKVIVKKLMSGLIITLPKARSALLQDIQLRLLEIYKLRNEIHYTKDDEFDLLLKHYAFEDKNPPTIFGGDYQEMMYRISSGDKNIPGIEEYEKAEDIYSNKVQKAYQEYNSPLFSVVLIDIKQEMDHLKKQNNIHKVLDYYQKIDLKLSQIELYLDQAVNDIHAAILHQIDLKRGK